MKGRQRLRRLRIVLLATAALGVTQVAAQTANGGPGDPSLAHLPGTPPNVTRTAPSVGSPRGRSKVPLPDIVTQSDQQFQREQKRMQRNMTICKGC